MKIKFLIAFVVLVSYHCNILAQVKLRTDISLNIGYDFRTNEKSILNKNTFDIGMNAFFRWENPSDLLNYDFLISFNYPTQVKDSNKVVILMGLMPGIRKQVSKNQFLLFNVGLLSDLGLEKNGYGIKAGYSKLFANNNHYGISSTYSSLGFFNFQIFFLFTLKSKY